MTRLQQINKFNDMVLALLTYAKAKNIPIRLGEAHRPWFTAKYYSSKVNPWTGKPKKKTGIFKSKHRYSVAIDIWITKTGKDIIKKDYRYNILGYLWESFGGVWGGHFRDRFDPYHFEFKGRPA